MNENLLEEVRAAESPDELLRIAEEYGLEWGEKEVRDCFEQIYDEEEI